MANPKPTYEVRRYMQSGGWSVVIRTQDAEKAAQVRDQMERTVGRRAPIDLVEVAQ